MWRRCGGRSRKVWRGLGRGGGEEKGVGCRTMWWRKQEGVEGKTMTRVLGFHDKSRGRKKGKAFLDGEERKRVE